MKRLWRLLPVLLAGCLLAGCGLTDKTDGLPDESGQAETGVILPEETTDFSQQRSREASDGQMPEEDILSAESFYYAYTTLGTAEERQLYQEILSSLLNREYETELTTLDRELVEPVFQRVMEDHPEIFYVDGFTSTAYKLGNDLKKLTFSGTYTMEEAEIRRCSREIQEVAAGWLEAVLEAGNDYEKVRYLYEFLISHTEYELGTADSQNICSVLLTGKSVCQGYAKTLQYLCQLTGIPALLVTGQVNGQGHAWNLLLMDGEWYFVDPTWGDASYQQEEDVTGGRQAYPSINYDYFGVTTEQIKRTHEITAEQMLPVCTATAANYYRREGLYLEEPDTGRIAVIFQEALLQGREFVTFQCADDATYQEVYRILIMEQEVFSYLPASAKTAAYADSPGQRTFSFWL